MVAKTNGEQSKSPKANLDKILVEEVGQFGRFQAWNYFLAVTSVIFIAWGNNSFVFTTARIASRCYIPECDLEDPEFTPGWLMNAVPGTSLDSFDNCQRFSSVNSSFLISGECPDAWFAPDKLEKCSRYVYQNKETVVYDYDLACDDWRRTLMGTIRSAAMIVALPLTGFVSDRWGRRTALTFSAFNTAWLGCLKYFASSYILFIVFDLIQVVLGGALFSSAYIIVMEMVGPELRVITGASLHTAYSSGLALMGLIAWALHDWRRLVLALYAPQLATIAYLWLLNESVRWYLSNGRYEDTEKALKKIARINKTTLSEQSVADLIETAAQEKRTQKALEATEKSEASLIVLVFRHKKILLRCIISCWWWITSTLVFHGLTINAVDISGNKYLNYMAVAAAQIPGYWIGILTLDRFGRKSVITCAYWLCAACMIGYIFVPTDQYLLSLGLYLLGTACIGTAATSLYIYTSELYPTPYRHRLLAFSSMVGRIGHILSPLTPALGTAIWAKFPFVLFAGFAFIAGALILLAPETSGARLPDTMQEAEDLGRKKNATST